MRALSCILCENICREAGMGSRQALTFWDLGWDITALSFYKKTIFQSLSVQLGTSAWELGQNDLVLRDKPISWHKGRITVSPVLTLEQECSKVWDVEIWVYHSCGTVAKNKDLWYFSMAGISDRTILHFFFLICLLFFRKMSKSVIAFWAYKQLQHSPPYFTQARVQISILSLPQEW